MYVIVWYRIMIGTKDDGVRYICTVYARQMYDIAQVSHHNGCFFEVMKEVIISYRYFDL